MSTPVRLTIPEPCHENWNQMTPNEQGRHCLSCQKTVVDFTLMSDQEILQHISTATSSVCGRFNDEQLNKIYREKKPRPGFTFRYMWQVMVSGFLWLGHSASAQANKVMQGDVDFVKTEKPKPKKKKKLKIKRDVEFTDFTKGIGNINFGSGRIETFISGFVVSEVVKMDKALYGSLKTFGVVRDEQTKRPLDSVSVRILGSKVDLAIDADGNFEFVSTNQEATVALEIEAKGYEKRVLNIPAYSLQRVEILMKPSVVDETADINALNGGTTLRMVGMVVPKIVEELEDVTLVVPASAKDVPVPDLAVGTIKVINDECECANPLELLPPPAVDAIGHWVVKDEQTQQPVSFATVKLKGSETILAADEEGRFEWLTIKQGEEATLIISAVGYETKELVITKGSSDGLEILLTPAADTLQAVEVKGWPRKVCHDVAGGVMAVREVPITEKITRTVKDTVQTWLPIKRELVAFPNPVQRGNLVNVQMNLKKTGAYKLELMDGAGRIVHVQALQVSQPSQTVSLPTQSVWSAGIYWLRVTNTSDKKVYQAKLLVQ